MPVAVVVDCCCCMQVLLRLFMSVCSLCVFVGGVACACAHVCC